MPRHLTETRHVVIVQLQQQGKSHRKISIEAEVTKTTLSNTIKRFQKECEFQERAGSGRKKIVTPLAETTLVRLSQHRFM